MAPFRDHTLYGWQTTSLDNYLAFFFTEQFGLQLSLDLGYGSRDNLVGTGNTSNDTTDSFFQIGVAVGMKYYLNRPTRERVSPYIYFDFFKYFASVSTNNANVTNAEAAYVAGLASPVGLDFAFGAEYFFTTSFSLGAEVLGIRYAYVEGSINNNGATLDTKEQYVTLYTGISLNYRFLATARVYTYEEEEDKANPRPAARRPKPRPAPQPNPDDDGGRSPESVD